MFSGCSNLNKNFSRCNLIIVHERTGLEGHERNSSGKLCARKTGTSDLDEEERSFSNFSFVLQEVYEELSARKGTHRLLGSASLQGY